jgi:hypothetical protein
MRTNLGLIDRASRWVVGLSIVALGLAYHQIWWVIGIPLVLTTFMGWCPLYSLFKMDTTGRTAEKPAQQAQPVAHSQSQKPALHH